MGNGPAKQQLSYYPFRGRVLTTWDEGARTSNSVPEVIDVCLRFLGRDEVQHCCIIPDSMRDIIVLPARSFSMPFAVSTMALSSDNERYQSPAFGDEDNPVNFDICSIRCSVVQ